LAAFLRSLPELCRVSYLPALHEILHTTNPFNWRLRQQLAIQLPELVALPPKPDVYRTLFPTVMTLLQDPVISVRTVTFEGVSAMINAIYEVAHNANGTYSAEEVETNKKNLQEVNGTILELITSDKCQLRQLFMELCKQLLKDIPIVLFEEYYLPGALILTCDKVLNVRLAVAMFLAGWGPTFPAPWEANPVDQDGYLNPWKWLLSRADIRACVERLSNEDRDIFLNVSKLQSFYPDIVFSSMSVRGRKVPPGGSTPVALNPAPLAEGSTGSIMDSLSVPVEPSHRSSFSDSSSYPMRARSNSSASFRNSLHEDDGIGMLRRLSISSGNDDDDDHPVHAHAEQHHHHHSICDMVDPDSFVEEREYVAFALHNAEVEEELDIIDGIMKSPAHAHSVDPHMFGDGIRHDELSARLDEIRHKEEACFAQLRDAVDDEQLQPTQT
jgi:hypothetical protein